MMAAWPWGDTDELDMESDQQKKLSTKKDRKIMGSSGAAN